MGNKTPLYDCHLKANAKIVDFAGWDMPLNYGSQIKEHNFVRKDVGVFDVSHMTILDIDGLESFTFLRYLLANDIGRLESGKALYTCMLDLNGGIIDDLIVYKIQDNLYRMIVNSSTRVKDLAWISSHAENFKVNINERMDLAILAIQGPNVEDKLSNILSSRDLSAVMALKPFSAISLGSMFIAKTGYTGEKGFEIIVPAVDAKNLWESFLALSVNPCGLGARDTLRIEAGLNLYGTDMDESVTPLESNLAWTVAFDPIDRDFIGRKALESQKKSGIKNLFVGLVLRQPGVLRSHQKVICNSLVVGETTSGSFSPILNKGIAFARVSANINNDCKVEIRGKQVSASVVRLPFVRQGKVLI
ncbi:glycine cleavage system aminomethyltransferase GcvT [Gammaproteobacteria bacterium]|nr:glycine cleavage system aminomethyltransferase GcvT [Gammaproteobacteria bacterium]